MPEQVLVHVQPRWSLHCKSNIIAEQALAVPLQVLDADQVQPSCPMQLRRSASDAQSDAIPEQLLESRHPSAVLHSVSVSIAHGVGVPEQDARPEPAPARSHQPAPPQRVRGGQSPSPEHFATQMPAPMHIARVPKVEQSSSSLQGAVH